MTFKKNTSDNDGFISLVTLLNEDLVIREDEDREFYD